MNDSTVLDCTGLEDDEWALLPALLAALRELPEATS